MGMALPLVATFFVGGITGTGVAYHQLDLTSAAGTESTTNASVSGQAGLGDKELTS